MKSWVSYRNVKDLVLLWTRTRGGSVVEAGPVLVEVKGSASVIRCRCRRMYDSAALDFILIKVLCVYFQEVAIKLCNSNRDLINSERTMTYVKLQVLQPLQWELKITTKWDSAGCGLIWKAKTLFTDNEKSSKCWTNNGSDAMAPARRQIFWDGWALISKIVFGWTLITNT